MHMHINSTKKQSIALLAFALFWPVLVLAISGDWHWMEGWIFGGWLVLTLGSITMYLYLKDPELLAERFRKNGSGNQKTWDKYFIILLRISLISWFIIMPLDAKRFGWSPNFPVVIKLIGVVLLIIASLFLFLSFKNNTFLSPHVRIQIERKQQLVTNGVYRIVRHPMYLSLALIFIGIPLLLNSCVGLALGIMMTGLLVVRITGEENMLSDKFEDYTVYKSKVRFKLIPFLW